jgi:predicted dehydrogenase
MKIAIIGYGYWGPNLVRNFSQVDGVEVAGLCDTSDKAGDKARRSYPAIDFQKDYRAYTRARDIDLVAISTPVFTHYKIAKDALENDKHIFVEKPFTFSAAQAEELIEIAERKNLIIMVDHTFLFTGAVRKIKELLDSGILGQLYYYDSTRVNLGLFQHDVNVIWDLAPHDFSILDHLIGERPESLTASATDHFGSGLADIAYVTVNFPNNFIAHFNVNWLSPVKVRQTLIGGDRKMLIWNDISKDEKIKIYDKGVEVESREGIYDLLISYRSGDMHSPNVEDREALRIEAEYFAECVRDGTRPFNDGESGLRVVRMLEACNKALKSNEKNIKI